MDYLLSFLTLAYLWLMGRRSIWGPALGAITQIFWIIFSINTKNYGLIICSIGIIIVQVNTYIIWWKAGEVK